MNSDDAPRNGLTRVSSDRDRRHRTAEITLSYSELVPGCRSARRERVQGERGSTRLALLDTSSPAVPVGLFGERLGRRALRAPQLPADRRTNSKSLLAQISPAVLVTDADRKQALSHLTDLTVVSRDEFIADSTADGPDPAGEWPMDPDDIAVLLYTSGTTGAPKAAVLRHKHLVSYILGSVEFMSADEQSAGLVCVPPYHIAGDGGDRQFGLLGAPHRPAAELRRAEMDRSGARGEQCHQRVRGADDVDAHHRGSRR